MMDEIIKDREKRLELLREIETFTHNLIFASSSWEKNDLQQKIRNREHHITVLDRDIATMTKYPVRHGMFVAFPRCEICKCELTHEWLEGDYTLLMCDKPQCWKTKSTQNSCKHLQSYVRNESQSGVFGSVVCPECGYERDYDAY